MRSCASTTASIRRIIMRDFRLLAVAALALLGAGCESAPVREIKSMFQDKGEPELAAGVKDYEEGNYKNAEVHLQAALDSGLKARADQVKAHKYLAFTYCVTN